MSYHPLYWYFGTVLRNQQRLQEEARRTGAAVIRVDNYGRWNLGFIVEELHNVPAPEKEPWWWNHSSPYTERQFIPVGVLWVLLAFDPGSDPEVYRARANDMLKTSSHQRAIEIAVRSVESLYDLAIPVGGALTRQVLLDGTVSADAVAEAIIDGFTLATFVRVAGATKAARIREIERNIRLRRVSAADWKWYSHELRETVHNARQAALDKEMRDSFSNLGVGHVPVNDMVRRWYDYNSVFSGIYNPSNKRVLIRASGQTRPKNGRLPEGRVPAQAGHDMILDQINDSDILKHYMISGNEPPVAFTMMFKDESTIVVATFSRGVNQELHGVAQITGVHRDALVAELTRMFNMKVEWVDIEEWRRIINH